MRIVLERPFADGTLARAVEAAPNRAGTYRPWAELLKRTFEFDVLACKRCGGRMRLLAVVTEPASVILYLAGIGEASDVPMRSPSRGPPSWESTVLRRKALGGDA